MFDLRNEDDIIRDVQQLNTICQRYNDYKSLLNALMIKFNIESADKCECRDYTSNKTFQERLNCEKCGGLGYILHYKEDTKEDLNNE